jgi:DNA invertase Pin-like site-specific DNA recombinase
MSKKAGVYVRVSSERQANEVSPGEQEKDCRAYCESSGWPVAKVYRDTKRYRVGKRLVEPTATRADRPGLKEMLKDAYAGHIDVIVAWREDRLYRSYRPMLDVLDCIDETGIDIELVKEHFDKAIAPVKAWAAKMELDAKHDRLLMGVAGQRLARGKPWNNQPPYGYRRVDGVYKEHPHEAEWIQKLFQWYAEGVAIREIRRRMIAGGAQQRHDVKRPWPLQTLRKYLRREYYHTGIQEVDWGGETYEIPVPQIVDTAIAWRVEARRARYKRYPAGNAKHRCLAPGLVYCQVCGTRMSATTIQKGYVRKSDGVMKTQDVYRCVNYHQKMPGCAKRRGAKRIDAEIWEKVWDLVSEPGRFDRALQDRIAALQAAEVDAEAECRNLNEELDGLSLERQKVVTWARKNIITEEDLETQLLVLTFQENSLKADLAEKQTLLGNRAERLSELAELFRTQIIAGAEEINAKPDTAKQAERQLRFRRRIVQAIVPRVDITPDGSVRVHVELEFPEATLALAPNAGVGDITYPSTR